MEAARGALGGGLLGPKGGGLGGGTPALCSSYDEHLHGTTADIRYWSTLHTQKYTTQNKPFAAVSVTWSYIKLSALVAVMYEDSPAGMH